jgi:hypothetical protein
MKIYSIDKPEVRRMNGIVIVCSIHPGMHNGKDNRYDSCLSIKCFVINNIYVSYDHCNVSFVSTMIHYI